LLEVVTKMGSAQSSAQGSFSIDPSGNITRKSSVDPPKAADSQRVSTETPGKAEPAPTTQTNETQPIVAIPPIEPPPQPIAPISAPTKQADGLSLQEVDRMASNLKAKYAPDSGRQVGLFDEIESKLTQCYNANRNQPMKCSKLNEEYRNHVEAKRQHFLKRTLEVPLIPTTFLVIITCLLLHLTTVSCYGAMSIDLGSEWMKVGLVAPSVQMDIVLNAQSQRKTPMAIAFSNGERYIGDTALDVASKYPEKTFTHFLDLVGKTVEHESVKHYAKRFPHINITSHQPNSTSILLNHPDGLQFTPLELLAMMIQHAHDQVTNRLNSNEPSKDVVITVPPFFDPIERRVVEDAAKLVGLNVLRLTNVNSAFALSYGIFRHKDYEPESSENRTIILFFDQGASHTSATLAVYHLVERIDEANGVKKNESLPTVTIKAQVYDRYLGGFDMQLKLRDHLIKEFAKSAKVDESKIYKRGRSWAKVLKESGRVKKILSANTGHLVRIENVIDDKDLKLPISRLEYEELNREYLESRITSLLDKLFEMPGVSRNDPLESVIIVGGNTRTPKIQQVLQNYFKLESLGKSINADEGAALAALYQAASLGRGFRVKRFVLEEFGEERKRVDHASTSEVTSESQQITVNGSDSATPDANQSVSKEDSNSIYNSAELERISKKLDHLREQDFIRLQRLSLRNSLESLLSEGKEKLSDSSDKQLEEEGRDKIRILISETYAWLEDGPQVETDNVTILAEKFNSIHELVHPKPPPPPPSPPFDPSTVDLSSVLNNDTLSILDRLKNIPNPFSSFNDSGEADGTNNDTDTSAQATPSSPVATGTSDQKEGSESSKEPEITLGPPPHSEL